MSILTLTNVLGMFRQNLRAGSQITSGVSEFFKTRVHGHTSGRQQDLNQSQRTGRQRSTARIMGSMAPVCLVLGLACAAAGAAVTAVGPDFRSADPALTPASLVTTIEPDATPIAPGVVRLPVDPLAAAGPIETKAKIASGDTLSAVLERLGVARIEAARSIQSLREIYDPRSLRAGDIITVNLAAHVGEAAPGRLLGLQLDNAFVRIAGVGRTIDAGLSAYEIVEPLTLEPARRVGPV